VKTWRLENKASELLQVDCGQVRLSACRVDEAGMATHERTLPPVQLLRLEPKSQLFEVRQRFVNLLDEVRSKVVVVPDEEGEVAELREEGEREEDVAADDGGFMRLANAKRAEGDVDGRLDRASKLRGVPESARRLRYTISRVSNSR
jgi:hypothetical protein